jgi:hypothetical protein
VSESLVELPYVEIQARQGKDPSSPIELEPVDWNRDVDLNVDEVQ